MGVYGVNRDVLACIPHEGAFGFDQLMLSLLERDLSVRVRPHAGFWLDIGRPDDYARAIDEFDRLRPVLLGDSAR